MLLSSLSCSSSSLSSCDCPCAIVFVPAPAQPHYSHHPLPLQPLPTCITAPGHPHFCSYHSRSDYSLVRYPALFGIYRFFGQLFSFISFDNYHYYNLYGDFHTITVKKSLNITPIGIIMYVKNCHHLNLIVHTKDEFKRN